MRVKSSSTPALHALVSMAAATAAPAWADYVWIQPQGGQAEVRAGELARPLARLPAWRQPQSTQATQAVSAHAEADRVRLSPAGRGDLRFTAVVPEGEGVLNHYQARFGREETTPVNDLELVPTTPGGNTFKLVWKGKTVAASQVNVQTSEGWSRVLRPDADGSVTLATPFAGLYVLEVSARVDGDGARFEDKRYADVRHTATLSFEVARP